MDWDASDLGCSQLVFQLRLRLDEMETGATLTVTARDPGAPIDIPAWCRSTGHELVSAEHPVYVIRRSATPDAS